MSCRPVGQRIACNSRRRALSLLSLSLTIPLAFTATTERAQAQARWGVHPSVAPVNPPDPSFINGISLRFNVPDNVWNFGEGVVRTPRPGFTLPPNAPADTGGYLCYDDGRDLVIDDIHPQVGTGWTTFTYNDPDSGTSTDLQRFRGFLAPHEFPTPADGFEAQSAFELFVPTTFAPGARTVILIATYPTMRGSGIPGAEFPGHPASFFADPANAGLQGTNVDPATGQFLNVRRPAELPRLAAFSGSPIADGLNIITAFIIPGISGGHMPVTTQRMLQLVRALQLMLDPSTGGALSPPQTTPPGPFPLPVCAMGGSNGGHVVQFLATHFPDVVHGAFSDQFSATMRHTAGFQEVSTYVTVLQGFSHTTEVHGIGFNLPFSTPYAQLGFADNWATGPTLQLWEAGLVNRPIFLHGADEDTVWLGGHELFPLLDWSYSPVGCAGGTRRNPGRIFWSMIDKGTHQPRGVFTLPDELLAGADGSGDPNTHPLAGVQTEPNLAVLPMLDEVIASFDCNPPNPADRPTEQQVKRRLFRFWSYNPDCPTDQRLDPFDHALARKSTHERRDRLCAPPPLLTDDPSFRRSQRALGTGLGIGEALSVDDAGGVWVGSADGVVSRLVRNGATDPSISPDALILDKRCRYSSDDDPTDGPFSLGYGVYGLAVDHGFVAAATHRRLLVYDLGNNPDLAGCDMEAPLSWNEQRPSSMRLVQNLFGDGGVQLVYLSFLGELVVREMTNGLPIRAWISDPGAADFEIGEGHPVAGWSKPIYIATRGHVVKMLLDGSSTGFPTNAEIHAATENFGAVNDLTWIDDNGTPALNVVFGQINFPSGISQLDPERLTTIASWDLPAEVPIFGAPQIDPVWPRRIACLEDREVVVLGQAELFYAPNPNDVSAFDLRPGNHANIVNMPSIYFAVGLATGDVGLDGEPDVVVATESGQVVYVPRSFFVNGSIPVMSQFVLGDPWFFNGLPPTPERWSSGSVSATWGMTMGPSQTVPGEDWIQVVDQCARRWEINPATGEPVFRNMVRDSLLGIFPIPATKPFRDLLFIDRNPASILTFPDFTRDIGPAWLPGRFFQQGSRPHVAVATPDNPVFLPFANPVPPNADIVGPQFVTYDARETYQVFENGYAPIAWGGDMIEVPSDPGRVEAYFFQGSTDILAPQLAGANTVQGLIFPGQSGELPEFFSSSTKLGSFSPFMENFKNPTALAGPHNCQSLRLGMWGDELRAVMGTAGGGVLVYDPKAPQGSADAIAERPATAGDHGFGGIGLEVANVRNDTTDPTIFFGTVYGHARKRFFGSGGKDITSSLHVYSYTPGPGAEPVETHRVELNGFFRARPRVFGICGIKTADLCPDTVQDGVDDELIVTTLDGDLMVFSLGLGHFSDGVKVRALLHHSVHDGALGANNSIIVDEQASPKVVYVAGSCGMHRFEVTGHGNCGWPF